MATSGTATFTRNRDQIITSALRKTGAFAAGETPDPESITDGAETLNAMIKHWQGTGIHIWRTTEATLFLQSGQSRYTLGTTATDHAMEDFTQTELTADALVGATTITVDSITDIATTYNIGIQVDDGTIHWTTVNGAPSGSTVTLTAGLDDSATDGAAVFIYQTKLVRPLKVITARRYNFIDGIETEMMEFGRAEYQTLPNKSATGSVTGYFYDRRGGANSTGLFYTWPTTENADGAVKLTVARPIEDFTAAGNDADLPMEWTEAVIWNLAERLAIEYDVPESRIARIERMAERLLKEVQWWETELQSYSLVPDMRG
jgi:hypothetical protein